MRPDEKAQFQSDILEQLNSQGKRQFRGPIAATISLSPSPGNPPQIHTAIKNLLDLFGAPLSTVKTKRTGLVYADDRQIAYLGVTYFPAFGTPRIIAQFASFKDFLLDLKLCRSILEEGSVDSSTLRRLGEAIDDDDFDTDFARRELGRIRRNRDQFITQFGAELYRSLEHNYRMQLQEDFLKTSRLSLNDIYSFYHASGQIPEYEYPSFPELRKLKESNRHLSQQMAQWLSRMPIRISLAKIPIQEGDSAMFTAELQESVSAYKAKAKILTPLLYPIRLEVIFKPPQTTGIFSKDLDNIMRQIVPVFTAEFRPPFSYQAHVDEDGSDNLDMTDSAMLQSSAIPHSLRTSVSGFDVFKVNRVNDDKDKGSISIGITGGIIMAESIWSRMDNLIDEWKETLN
jgi:hypothetical protein